MALDWSYIMYDNINMPIDGIEWDDAKNILNKHERKGEVTMGTIVSTIKVGQKPTKKEMARIRKELRQAKKQPVNLKNCPEGIC